MSDSIFPEREEKNLSHTEEVLATESFVSRQIVSEIMSYGVTQNQVLKIIEFLAMELENREDMLTLVANASAVGFCSRRQQPTRPL